MTSDSSSQHFYVYVLLSLKDHKFYVGFSEDLKRRMEEHTQGKVRSTKTRRPLQLIHYEMYITKEDALSREIFLKSGFGREQTPFISKTNPITFQHQKKYGVTVVQKIFEFY